MQMTKIISFYMIRYFLISFAAVLLFLLSLIFLVETIEMLRRFSNKDVEAARLLFLAFLKTPQTIEILLPFAVMIAAFIVFWRLNRSSELVIIRAAGVSVWEFLMPLVISAFVLGTVYLFFVNPIGALMNQRYEQLKDLQSSKGGFYLTSSPFGLWLREKRPDGRQIIFSAFLKPEGSKVVLTGVHLFERDEKDAFICRIESLRGEIDRGELTLKDSKILEAGAAGFVEKPLIKMPTALSLGKIQENFASLQTVSFWDLFGLIKFLDSTGFSSKKQRLRLHSLISTPVLLCAMILVAAVFSLSLNQRQGKVLLKIVGGAVTGFLLFFISQITQALGASTTIPVILAAWTPCLVFLFLSTTILLHQEDA